MGPALHPARRPGASYISLTDEDNGNFWSNWSGFDLTYPRPWFGNFVKRPGDSAPRLYAWGGYDAGFKDSDGPLGVYWRASSPRNPSGFYYEGSDGPVTGCVNPKTRPIMDDPTGSGAITAKGGIANCVTYNLFTEGQSRPLVNGDWMDCLLIFMPDGSCMRYDWMQMRHAFGQCDYSANYWFNLVPSKTIAELGPGDMCNGTSTWDTTECGVPFNNLFEASDWDAVTGMFYITLGPDVPNDKVDFANAGEALASEMPMYRVGVSRAGEVKVFKVTPTMPAGTVLDGKWQGAAWHAAAVGNNGFWNNVALSAKGATLMPAETFATPAMMANMQWWIDP